VSPVDHEAGPGSTTASTTGPRTWAELTFDHLAGSTRPAVVDRDVEWAGDELLARAGGVSEWLDEIGVPAGSAVPALVEESAAAVALAVGTACSARPLAPLGTRFPSGELVEIVRALGAPVLVADPDLAGLAAEVASATGTSFHLLDPSSPRRAPVPRAAVVPSDVAAIIHTSGTTGRPQPIFMRQQPLAARVEIYGRAIEMGEGDRYASASPFFHVAGLGMVLVAIGLGATVLPVPRFSIDEWRRAAALQPTHALLVPTMIDILLAEGLLDAAGLRVLQYGAAPIHPDTVAEALAALPGTRLAQIFGQTEVSPVTVLSHEDHLEAMRGRPELLASVGRPVPEIELRIEDADADGVGELVVRGPHVFAADPDGWRRMGDLGRLDADGYLSLRGRRHDRIVRGGENIYPVEIEVALATHPGVAEAAVVGVPDRRWGEIVKAVVVPRGTPPSVADLQAHVRDRLAHFKVPAIVEFVDELPRTASGKVLRRALKT